MPQNFESTYDPTSIEQYYKIWDPILQDWEQMINPNYASNLAKKNLTTELGVMGSKDSPASKLQVYLSDYLKNLLGTRMPNIDEYRQNAQGSIGKATNEAVTKAKERMAASGLSKSGIAQGVYTDIYGGEANALGNVETSLAEKELDWKHNAIAQLLGLAQLTSNTESDKARILSSLYGTELGNEFQNKQLGWENYWKKESQDDWLGNLLGGIFGTGAQVGATYLLTRPTSTTTKIARGGIPG